MIARRNILTALELLRAAPEQATLQNLDASDLENYWATILNLYCLDGDFNKVVKILRPLASEQNQLANQLAARAIMAFPLAPDTAGRSERARNAANSLTAKNFGEFVAGLAAIKELSAYREAIPKAFADFCRYNRPVTQDDIDAVLAPLQERSEDEMMAFNGAMLELLTDVIPASPKGNDPALKLDGDNWGAKIGEEYQALDAVLVEWKQGRETSRGDLMRASTLFAWANHELEYVRLQPEPSVQKKEQTDQLTSKTDADGFREHMGEWSEYIKFAADRVLADGALEGAGQISAFGEILGNWFYGTMEARSKPAFPKADGDKLLEGIRICIGRLPETARQLVLDEFALKQLGRLDPPPLDSDELRKFDKPIKEQRRFDFIEAVTSLAPDTSASAIFNGILEDYWELKRDISFHVVPEGEIYDSGAWAEDSTPTYPVDGKEFGVWFTLVHTDEAKKASGGFRRYTEDRSATPAVDSTKSRVLVIGAGPAGLTAAYLLGQSQVPVPVIEADPCCLKQK